MTAAPSPFRRLSRVASTFFVVLAAAFGIAAMLPAQASAGMGAPAIWSDRPDYAPGETVTLNGDGWGMGEVVHINVNDSAGQTWSRDVDVTADFFGNITDQFVLPDWFVATYAVTATGPSGTATATFTDGNVRARSNASGTTFRLDWTEHANTQACGGSAADQGFNNNVGFSGGARFSKGVPNPNSIVLEAADSSNQGGVFTGWTGDSASDTFVARPDAHEICVPGNFTGTREYVANYAPNSPPTVTRDNATRMVDEGQTATNSGTFGDANVLDTVTLTASVGTVATSGTHSGTWSWSFNTNDGPAQSQTVTITATDNHGATSTTTFSLTVNNVAPTAGFSNDGPVDEGSSFTLSLTDGDDVSSADKAAKFEFAFDCGDGSGYGAWSSPAALAGSRVCATDDNGSRAVKAKIRDKDGGVSEYTTAVTVDNMAPTATFPATHSINEGSPSTFAFTSPSDPSSADTTAGFHYAFSCTGTSLASATYDGSGTASSVSCTFEDGPSSPTVRARIIDKDGGFSEYTTAVTVDNVAPTVAFTAAPATVDEGQTNTYMYSISDPGVDTITSVATSCGANGTKSNASNTNTSGSFDCSFPDGPASSTVSAQATDSDGDAGNTATQMVTVANVAPTVSLSGTNAAEEGQSKNYTFTVTDPGQDTFTVAAGFPDCGTGGSFVAGSLVTTASGGTFSCSFPDGPASPVVRIKVDDSDGAGSNIDSIAVTVSNVAPTVSLNGAANVNEGSTHTYSFTVTDPGTDTFTVSSGYPTCGSGGSYVSGSLSTTAGGGSFDCTFPDGPATTSVAIKVADSDGASDTDSEAVQVVQVANRAPVVTAAANQSSDEGEAHSFSLGSFSDDGAGDGPWAVSVDWGDGSPPTNYSVSATGSLGSKSHTYADGPKTRTVAVTVTDKDADGGSADYQVSVVNVVPTVSLSGANAANEGESKTYTFSVSDPGADSFTIAAGFPDCGTGGNLVSGSLSTSASGGFFQCSYPDGPASPTVRIQVEDSDGAPSNIDLIAMTVANVAPTVTLSGSNDLSVNEGSTHTYSYSISDPGQDTITAALTSCSGTGNKLAGSDSFTNASGSFQCSFADGPNSSMVSAAATDSDGDTGAADTQSVTVNNVAPTVTLAAPNDLSVNEGSTHAYSYSISDPGADTVSSVATSCGANGTKSNASNTNTSGTFDCSFPDGPASSTVSAQATDSDGDAGNTATQSVTVSNVAPTLTLSASNDLSANEGSTHTYTYSISDPGADTVSSVATSCGANGTKSNASNTNTSGTFDCSFPDGPASSTVSAQATDSDGDAGNTATQSVTVNNVAPHVEISGAANVNEGSTHTYSFTVADPGQDAFSVSAGYPTCGTGGTYAAGSLVTTPSGGSFDCSFPDGPATTNVAIRVADSDGASDTDSEAVQVVQVENSAPSVTAPADQSSDEGESRSFSLGSFTDNGENDSPWGVTVAWGDASPATSFSVTSTGSLGSKPHAYADGPATHTVTVTVTDKDGDSDSKTFEVSVNNVAPSVTVFGPANADEGSTQTYSFTVSDPGQDGFTVKAGYPDCGSGGSLVAGSFSTNANGGTFDCSFPDGPASPIVSVQARDADEPAGSTIADSNVATRAVSVANVAPTVNVTSGATSADESETKTYSFSVSDPGVDTYAASTGYPDCGTGGSLVSGSYSVSGDSGAQTGSFQCSFPDGPATANVRIRFTDSDGDAGNIASRSVTVSNSAPSATFNAPSSVNEGDSINLSLTDPSDPSSVDTAAGFTYAFDCGSGYSAFGTSNSASCPTSDNGTRTVKGKIRDKDGGESEYTKQVAVGNAAPQVTVTSPEFGKLYAKPAIVTVNASFTDAGKSDTHTCSFNWDDGTSSPGTVTETPGSGSGTCSGTHTYNTAGVYTLKITVTDDDGASTTVEWMVVVYDPSAGFVTGGGWIDVAGGSYPADPTLAGRANFGFTSKYKNGAATPTGETEFNFQVASFKFHSTSYQWLVVSGFKAQYKGAGQVNGVPGYEFRLTAYDGQVAAGGNTGADRFRIKIAKQSTGEVVFDNRLERSDDVDLADPQQISGGSIVIHKP